MCLFDFPDLQQRTRRKYNSKYTKVYFVYSVINSVLSVVKPDLIIAKYHFDEKKTSKYYLLKHTIDKNEAESFITTAVYKKLPHNWTVHLNTRFEKQYDGGGADGLVDGIRGVADWRKGNWQGYQNADVDVVIDLKAIKRISNVHAGFLQDTRSWIVMPKNVFVEVSADNKNFIKVYESENFLPIENLEPQLKAIDATFKPVKARYVRIKAKQYGKLPAWHEGAGGATHIFIDEIEVNKIKTPRSFRGVFY